MAGRYSRTKGGADVNTEELKALGHDIDSISLDADRMSRHLARLAERFGVKPPPEPNRNAEPADEQIASACLSYSRDYGLMTENEQRIMRFIGSEWLKAWRKEGLL